MVSQLESDIQRIAERTAQALGVELYWLDVRSSGPRWRVTVYIDRAGGVSIDDCERVSRALEGPLDALIDHSYELEVSSPGIDRPLVTRAHYERAIGKPIEVRLLQTRLGQRVLLGRLAGLTQNEIVLIPDRGEPVHIALQEIESAQVIESRFL